MEDRGRGVYLVRGFKRYEGEDREIPFQDSAVADSPQQAIDAVCERDIAAARGVEANGWQGDDEMRIRKVPAYPFNKKTWTAKKVAEAED
jgi:hypothetical protein